MTRILRGLVSLVRSPAAVYLAASIFGRAGSIVLIPLYTRRLTAVDYGTYALALTLLSILPLVIALGLNAGLMKEFYEAKTPAEARTQVGAVAKGMLIVAATLTGLLALVTLTFFRRGIGPLDLRQLLTIEVAALGTAASIVPDSYLRASQRPYHIAALQIGTLTLNVILGITLVAVLGRGVYGAIETAAGTALSTGLFGACFTWFYLGGDDVIARTRRRLGFSISFIPHFVASWAQDLSDRWLLATFGDARTLGPYHLAGQLLSPVPMVVAAWNSMESPRVGETYRALGMAGVRADLKRQFRRFAMVGFGPALAIVILSPAVASMIGTSMRSALSILPLLSLAYAIDALYYPGANAVFLSTRPRLVAATTLTSAVCGLSLAFVLLRSFGLPGLLAARIVTSSLRACLMGAAGWVVSRSASAGE